MAITRTGQVVSLGATGDELTGVVGIQAIMTTGTDIVLQSDEVDVFKSSTERVGISFPAGLRLSTGIKRTAGTGDCFLYLL